MRTQAIREVKALGMEEASVATPGVCAGSWRSPSTSIESGRGLQPLVTEKGHSVAIPGHPRAPEHMPRARGAAGCSEGPWADAEASTPSWAGGTEPGLGEGSRGSLNSPRDDEGSALDEAMLIDPHRVARDDAAHSTSRLGPGTDDPLLAEDRLDPYSYLHWCLTQTLLTLI